MNKLLRTSDFFDDFFGTPGERRIRPSSMPYNSYEQNDNYYIEVALAGYKSDEIIVQQERNGLKIIAKKHIDETDEKKNYTFKGITEKNATLSFLMPVNRKVENVEFDNGLLRIQLSLDESKNPVVHKITSK